MRTSFATFFVIGGLIASSVAKPAYFRRQATDVCATGTPNCCDVDVLGIADLDCTTPPSVPTTVADFTTICADIGKDARCCDIDLLEQGLICSAPI